MFAIFSIVFHEGDTIPLRILENDPAEKPSLSKSAWVSFLRRMIRSISWMGLGFMDCV